MNSYAKYLVSFGSGLLFAVGLVVGGMTQPAKVVGFLDFFGSWDPSLAFVMGGAVVVYAVVFRWVLKKKRPWLAPKFRIPTRSDLTWQLVGGSALFGVGWGLAGYCPGPALTSVATVSTTALVFVASMTGGMLLYKLFDAAVLSNEAKAAPEADSQAVPERIAVPSSES